MAKQGMGFAAAALVAALALQAPGGVLAASSGGTAESGAGDERLAAAEAKIAAADYAGAIPLLEQVVKAAPDNADALNELGFSHRKLGDRETALAYYLQALAIAPAHLGANEYLGELYLEMGDLAKAEERLAVLTQACGECEEKAELEEQIEAWKARPPS